MTDVVEDVLDAPGGSTEVSILDPIQRIQAGLIELKAQAGPFDISTTAGMKAARQFRALCVKARTALDAAYEKVNRPLLDTQRAARDLKKAITEEILQLETPVDEAITADEQRRERERQARIAAEQERVDGIQRRIRKFASFAVRAMGEPSATVEELVRELVGLEPDATFAEFQATAAEAHAEALAGLRGLLEKARQQEVEAERLERERAELEAARQAQEASMAEERARLAAERQAEEDRRAEQARQEAEERAERERQEAAARQAEADRQRAERERQEAELRRQREEQEAALAEQRRQQEAAAEAERQRLASERAELERQRQEQEAAEQRRREEEEARARAEREAAEQREREARAERDRLAAIEVARLDRLHAAAPVLLQAARMTVLMLKQLGGMLPGTKEVIDSVVETCEQAIAEATED